MAGVTVYVVFRHDRHCDPDITVHTTRDGADAALEEFKTQYELDAGERWIEQDYGEGAGWLRYIEIADDLDNPIDDGPSARIEEKELVS